MKFCPAIKGRRLTRKPYNMGRAAHSYSEMALSKRYGCKLCMHDHLYCVLCKIMVWPYDWYNHHTLKHKILSELHHRGYMLAVDDNGKIGPYMSIHMEELHIVAPQLFALKLERCRTYECSLLRSLTPDEVRGLIWENAFDNEYSCCLCENTYDSFPTKKVVWTHLKKCCGAPALQN